MVRHRGTVLVDTNVILEAHRTGFWRALTGGYAVETVEDCVTETQTGFQRRRPEHQLDQAELRNRLAGVHAGGEQERAVPAIRAGELALDRAVRLDGTPVAGHRSLDGGVVIEDVHDLVGRSVVAERRHATSMASLILRGDLTADGVPVQDSRLLCIPVLVDAEGGASSPEDRLFVDVVHVALTRALAGAEPLAPEAFVVNFSVGIRRSGFAGRISSLARLLDWWAHSEGVLFVVSSGNVLEDLGIPGMTSVAFEEATLQERRELVAAAQRAGRHERTLLAPSEALNASRWPEAADARYR